MHNIRAVVASWNPKGREGRTEGAGSRCTVTLLITSIKDEHAEYAAMAKTTLAVGAAGGPPVAALTRGPTFASSGGAATAS